MTSRRSAPSLETGGATSSPEENRSQQPIAAILPVVPWLTARGICSTDLVALLVRPRGTAKATASVLAAAEAARRVVEQYATGFDVWISLQTMNPVEPGRKGGAGDVAALVAIAADIDVKTGGMPSWDAARAVIADLTAMLGTGPVSVTMTGHGLQPIWQIERLDLGAPDSPERAHAAQVLRRFQTLVTRVAAAHGGTVDNIANLDRMLRVPGTMNVKGEPVMANLEPLL